MLVCIGSSATRTVVRWSRSTSALAVKPVDDGGADRRDVDPAIPDVVKPSFGPELSDVAGERGAPGRRLRERRKTEERDERPGTASGGGSRRGRTNRKLSGAPADLDRVQEVEQERQQDETGS
jgi:hypothetical protein